MSSEKPHPPTQGSNWSVGAGNYDVQRQLDYILYDGVLTRATEVPAPRHHSPSAKQKDNWTGST
jgi:hypothetical protein